MNGRRFGDGCRLAALGVVVLALGVVALRADTTPLPSSGDGDAGVALFKEHVAPVFLAQCVKCHGGEKTRGDFDLTTRAGLLHPGAEGPNVLPGKSGESRLMKLLRHEEEPGMPQKGERLSDGVIAKIAEWIDAGAPYDKALVEKAGRVRDKSQVTEEDRGFWSFKPLAKVEVPAVKDEAWAKTPVDRFVLAKLEEKGIRPNGVAEKRKLIRRATLDLTGLPPTAEETEAFVKDEGADAYERLIDRLLASPHYGERWGRHWLDVARFAESHGYEQDYDRPTAYHYRDFVIRALNEDMAYDRFVKLQLAGDEIEPENVEALKATGFLGAGTHATQITASQAEKERYDELDDMAATTGVAFLGLTVGCARCHDHKFDPVPTRDYYRMISAFTTTVRSDMELELEKGKYEKAKAEWDAKHAKVVEALKSFEREHLPSRMENWLASDGPSAKVAVPKWIVLEMESTKSAAKATFTRLDDGSYLASGANALHDTYTFVAKTPLRKVTAIKLEALADGSMVKGGPGRAANGNFALSNIAVTAAPLGENGKASSPPTAVKLVSAKATFDQAGLPVANAIDSDNTSAWAIDPQFGKDHAAVFGVERPVESEHGVALTITLSFANNHSHTIGRARVSATDEDGPATLDGEQGSTLVLDALKILEVPATERTDAQRGKLLAWYRTIDDEWKKLDGAVQESVKRAPKRELAKVLVCSEGVPAIRLHTQGPDFYEKTYFLKRGDLGQKDGEATLGFPQVLVRAPEGEKRWIAPPPAGSKLSYRRTALAKWITDTEQGAGHLLARVIVNRLWQHHMARGIVGTPNDFGAQGERPTHPELLDYLAARLIEGGWKLKPIHKLIMTSAAYMQSSEYDDARAAVDRENLLHWRRGYRRLEAETIRDSMLAVSGELDRTMYGPGSLDEGMTRRSIYFFVKRSRLIPLMTLFDVPEPLSSQGARPATTVAPQALALMNNVQVQKYARGYAQRVAPIAERSLAEAVRWSYVTALGREPDAEEREASVRFVQQQAESYTRAGRSDARELALADFCQGLFCLNEFVYVD